MLRTTHLLKPMVLGIAVCGSSLAMAVPMHFVADLEPLSGSGVSGRADLTLNDEDNTLLVRITASGLEAGMPHAQHIHGRMGPDGMPMNSVTPTMEDDTDGDDFIELAEGLPAYGPIIVPLTSPPGGEATNFPTAPDGTITFEQMYDLTSSATFADGFDMDDLLPLDLREIVLHGMTVGAAFGEGTPGEVDGTAGYKAVLPVAAGEIRAAEVPEPGTLALLGLGIGALGYKRAKIRQLQ